MLSDICDGSIFTSNPVLRRNQQALQIIGYYDELTLTNPLMSRAKKYKIGMIMFIEYTSSLDRHYNPLGAIYFMLGNIDPALRSRLEAINLVALFRADLLKNYSIDLILQPFIDDLRKLASVSVIIILDRGRFHSLFCLIA